MIDWQHVKHGTPEPGRRVEVLIKRNRRISFVVRAVTAYCPKGRIVWLDPNGSRLWRADRVTHWRLWAT